MEMAEKNLTTISYDMMTTIFTTLQDESVTNSLHEFNKTENALGVGNISNGSHDVNHIMYKELEIFTPLFDSFVSTEIVMTALELIISIVAALKIPRWTKNYRNQMLMQLSLARFVKRIVYYIEYLEEKRFTVTPTSLSVVLFGAQTYIDIVTVILVVFFIKHMYDSLIVVMVKIYQHSLYKMLSCAWLLPLPISAALAGIISAELVNEWWVYFLICCIFRWPLILIGTIFYITILFRVFTDKMQRFARGLTFTTFLICLVVNFYLFSKDVIELWCYKSLVTVLVNYVSGFLLNLLILCFYLILIIQNYKKRPKSSNYATEHSIEREVKSIE